jgi:hypothetical protein
LRQAYALEKGRLRAHILGGMAARNRWEADMKCPGCGRTGHAQMSEDHAPGGGDYGRSVDSLSEGFKVVHRKPSQDSDIVCVKCNMKPEWI